MTLIFFKIRIIHFPDPYILSCTFGSCTCMMYSADKHQNLHRTIGLCVTLKFRKKNLKKIDKKLCYISLQKNVKFLKLIICYALVICTAYDYNIDLLSVHYHKKYLIS